MFKRTHTCGELDKSNVGEEVQLNGWINTVRLHGKIVFVDLRDRYGKTQLIFDEKKFPTQFENIKKFSANKHHLFFNFIFTTFLPLKRQKKKNLWQKRVSSHKKWDIR